jgi:energy-coupling factor transport system permease protein
MMNMDFYRPGTSLLHRLDPRAKLFLLLPTLACFFLSMPVWLLAAYAAAIMVLVALSLGPRELIPPLKAIAPVLILICLLTPPFHRQGAALIRVQQVTILTADGARETVLMILRFFGITFGFFAVVRTISLDELVLSLRWFGLPYSGCLVVIIALRTMPSLAGTWRNVMYAHRLRAGATEEGRRRKIIATYLPVLTSLLIEAVKGIPVLAMVLESRGFGRRAPRTSLAELRSGRAFAAHIVACAVLTLLLVWPAFVRF